LVGRAAAPSIAVSAVVGVIPLVVPTAESIAPAMPDVLASAPLNVCAPAVFCVRAPSGLKV
jgi:hypothetical protein